MYTLNYHISFLSFSFSFLSFLSFLHARTSLSAAINNGISALANNGEYTAYVCSAGKYSSASIPGLKNAREARTKDCAE